jgi:hypothetical protein
VLTTSWYSMSRGNPGCNYLKMGLTTYFQVKCESESVDRE